MRLRDDETERLKDDETERLRDEETERLFHRRRIISQSLGCIVSQSHRHISKETGEKK